MDSYLPASTASPISAEAIRAFITHRNTKFDISKILTTDQGTQIESHLFDYLGQILGIRLSRIMPFHPAGNGLVERFHPSLKETSKCRNQLR